MRACQKTNPEIRKLDRDHGFRIYRTRPSRRRVMFEIGLIIFGFIASISLIKAIVSSIH